MGESRVMRRVELAMMAAIVALAMAFCATSGAKAAYADEGLQAGAADLTTQSQEPIVKAGVAKKLLYPGQDATIKIKNKLKGQTGTWTVTSSDPKVVKAAINPGSATDNTNLSTKITVTGVKQGTAMVTVGFTTDSDMYAEETIKVQVTGLAVGKIYKVKTTSASNLRYMVKTNKSKTNTGAVRVMGSVKRSDAKIIVPGKVKIAGRTYTVTQIGTTAFQNMKKLSVFTVNGTSLTGIGKYAFDGTKSLKTIKIKSTNLKTVKKNVLKGSSIVKVKVPKAKVKDYKKFFTESYCGKDVKLVAI